MQEPAAQDQVRATASERALRAGIVVGLAYSLIGWRGLLVPSMIRSVEPSFGQDDAGMGLYFLATAVSYGVGVLAGGRLVRARGQRFAVAGALATMCVGLILQGVTGSWPAFVALGVLVSLGASAADIGINSLVLDLFPSSRGRALNLLHVMYSVGALAAPLALAATVGAGVAWQVPMLVSGVVAGTAAIGVRLTVPPGQLDPPDPDEHPDNAADVARGRRIPCLPAGHGSRDGVLRRVGGGCVRLAGALPGRAAGDRRERRAHVVLGRDRGRPDRLRADRQPRGAGGGGVGARTGGWRGAAGGLPAAGGSVDAGAVPGRRLRVRSVLPADGRHGRGAPAQPLGDRRVDADLRGGPGGDRPPAIGFISVAGDLQVAMVGTALLAFATGAAALASRRVAS